MAKPKSAGNRAVLYVRVSSQQQADEGISLEAQQERLRAYCALRGLDIIEVVVDPAQSAFKTLASRPGGKTVLELLRRKKVDAVVALKLDRLFRNTVDCLRTVEAWDKAGVALHLIDMGGCAIDTSSAVGKVFITMLAGFAEFERNQTSERTQLALAHKVSKGQLRIGSEAPYGYRHDKDSLAALPSEQAVIELVRALRGQGMTFRGMCSELSRLGHRSRSGGHFAPVQLERMLKGPQRLRAA
ncbi:MAG: recombinase family protein [Pseudomonadota bacterium]